MKALTIHQPWAELIAAGTKRVENRTWATMHRGPIAIHAGKADTPELRATAAAFDLDFDTLALGAIVAVADIVDCLPLIDALQRRFAADELAWLADHAHAHGPYCWVLANVRRIERPIPAAGRQSLWNLTAEQVAAVESQLG